MAWSWGDVLRGAAAVGTGGASELAYGYFNAGDPYKGAAAGARDISEQQKAFSGEQWNRQMEGLEKAQGAYAPSQAAWYNMYGSQGPGAMENWQRQNASAFTRDPTQRQAYTGYQDWMNQGVNATQQGANAANQYLGGPTASSQAYGAMGQQLQGYNGPQSGRDAFNFNQPSFQQAGTGESFYNQNKARYGQETNAQSQYEYAANKLQDESTMNSLYTNMQGKFSDQEMASKLAMAKHQGFAEGPTALQQNEAENKGMIRGASQAGDYYGSQLGALTGPGQYEQFVTSDISGRNPLYERTRQRGVDTINQEMARRGQFGSGGAVDRIGNYTAELDAQDYQNRANRAKDAQQMQLARIGQGQQAALGVSGLDVQRGGALGQLDTASEQAQLGRRGFGLQAEKQATDAQAMRDRLQFDMAQSNDQTGLARLMAGAQLGSAADTSNLNLLNAGQGAASDAQSQMLQRLMGYQGAANQVDQTRLASDQQGLARQMASYNMAQGSDQSGLARAQQLFNQGQGLDQNMMARFAQQAQMGQGLDQFTLQQLMSGGQMAGAAQNAEQQRMQQAFGSLFGMNNAQAGQYQGFYGQGGQLAGASFSDAMNALSNAYGLQAQGDAAPSEYLMKLMGMGLQGASMAGGRKA
jgi:hypothetical protein